MYTSRPVRTSLAISYATQKPPYTQTRAHARTHTHTHTHIVHDRDEGQSWWTEINHLQTCTLTAKFSPSLSAAQAFSKQSLSDSWKQNMKDNIVMRVQTVFESYGEVIRHFQDFEILKYWVAQLKSLNVCKLWVLLQVSDFVTIFAGKNKLTIRIASHFACLSNNTEMATVTSELWNDGCIYRQHHLGWTRVEFLR